MKIIQSIVSLFLLLLSLAFTQRTLAQKKNATTIQGHVAARNPSFLSKYNWVWLYKGFGSERELLDSAKVDTTGVFTLKLKSSKPEFYSLDIVKWQTASFYSDADIHIEARGYDTSRVKMRNSGFVKVMSNSPVNRLINAANYNNYIASLEMEELNAEWISSIRNVQKDSTWSKYIKSDGLIRKKSNFELLRLENLILTNADNPGVIYLLSLYPTETDSEFFEKQVEDAVLKFPNSSDLKNLQSLYQKKKEIRYSLKKGSQIPDLAYPNVDNKVIDIKNFKGKYVLIDFWASWCGPCRKAIPAIKELYETYKDQGFDVVSVSIDTNREAWIKAMQEENMPWSQVLSPNKNETLKEFMIIGIPTLFLINREGKIVDKFTGFSEDLKNKVSKSFENEA